MTEQVEGQFRPGSFRTDLVDDMSIDWDVPIPASDGIVLRADVFRPATPGAYPAILSLGPYAKGRAFQEFLPGAWQKLVADYPEILQGSSNAYQNFEVVDPERWVPDGYVCVRVDSRGTGRSPGYLDPFIARGTLDLYECIEWAAQQPWSDGKIGLCGISYLAINQWQVAALQPPHLTAICVWEGAGDLYRDAVYHGGILSTFADRWYSLIGQYGNGDGGVNSHTGQSAYGDEIFTPAELERRRADLGRLIREHPLLDEFHRDRINPDWTAIQVPLLAAGNWGGMGLHLRGTVHGFEQAASRDKWLTMHEDTHFAHFYSQYGLDLQKRFFGHFLKGEQTSWADQPRVELRTRRATGGVGLRTGATWPLPETSWTRLHLDAADGSMRHGSQPAAAHANYVAMQAGLSFTYRAPRDIEIAGHVAAKIYLASTTADADLFLVLRAFSPDGTEIVFQGANDPGVPVAQGWLRASHRTLDHEQSRPFMPVHRHERREPLDPGTIYEVDIEILPTSLNLPAGYTLVLEVQGHDYTNPATARTSGPTAGSGSFLHNDPADRPAELYGGVVTLHTGGECPSYLLLPVIAG